MVLDRASQIGRRYSDREFAEDIGRVERGAPYAASTLTEWYKERNEPGLATFLAMEVVLERPGAACYLAFGCWPAEGAATPGAVAPASKLPLPDPRKTARAKPAAKLAAVGGRGRKGR